MSTIADTNPEPRAGDGVPRIADDRPGWLSRVFHLEVGRLIACDARWTGCEWRRDEPFTFLYATTSGRLVVLESPTEWHVVSVADARRLFATLPCRLGVLPEPAGEGDAPA